MSAPINFDNARKDLRRRTVWNIVKQVSSNRADSIVLYLSGRDDLEREPALRAGFKFENLIAVETDLENVAELRRRGVIVIPRPIDDVLASWPFDKPVSAVLADLQCGLESSVTRLMTLWRFHPAFAGALLYLNLQRGREHNDNARWVAERFAKYVERVGAIRLSIGKVSTKHRGMIACYWLNAIHCFAVGKSIGRELTRREMADCRVEHRLLAPYRSGRVVMDGVVMFNDHTIDRQDYQRYAGGISEGKSRQYVAAALALRTCHRQRAS